MGKNLYVGNLAVAVTETDLETNFEQVGLVVSVNIITDRYTRLSRGFGFIEMGTEDEAKEAIRRFDNGDLLGKTIKVNEVRTKTNSRTGGLRSSGQGPEHRFGRGGRYY